MIFPTGVLGQANLKRQVLNPQNFGRCPAKLNFGVVTVELFNAKTRSLIKSYRSLQWIHVKNSLR